MTPTGAELLRQPLQWIVDWLLIFGGLRHTMQMSRNEYIRLQYAAGETLTELARAFGISPQRVHQIVNFKQK